MREVDERTLSLASRIGASLPAPVRAEAPTLVSADVALGVLERLYPDGRVALLRVADRDWECRTIDGDVGRGDSAGAALVDLCHVLTT